MTRKCTKELTLMAFLLVAAVLPAAAERIDRQVPVNRSNSTTKTDLAYKNAVLARNTPAKSDATATTAAPAKEQTKHDKKAVGRCWTRLMSMFREINIAHRNRTK